MIKQFLKPDWRKIFISIILSILIFGEFLSWVKAGHPSFGPSKLNQLLPSILIIWIYSCLIIWIYDKIRRKSPPIAIGIIIAITFILIILVGGFIWQQYEEREGRETRKEEAESPEINIPEKEKCEGCKEKTVSWCQECKSLGWPRGNQDSPILQTTGAVCLIECFNKELPYTAYCYESKDLCKEFGVK